MLRVLEKYEALKTIDGGDPYLEVKNGVFKINFGPWQKGYVAYILRMDYKRNTIAEYNEKGVRVVVQDVRLMTHNSMLEEIIKWMDHEDDDTLYTKDGRKVWRFYSGTLIDKYLRRLYEETLQTR